MAGAYFSDRQGRYRISCAYMHVRRVQLTFRLPCCLYRAKKEFRDFRHCRSSQLCLHS